MPEHDDDIDALRRADPLDLTSLPAPHEPEAQALFERITMTDTINHPATDPHEPAPPAGRRTRVFLAAAAAAAVIVLAIVGGALALRGDDDEPDLIAQAPSTTNQPIITGGPALGSCVEIYDLQTLANRETAFDGTVVSVDGDRVTFTVNEWFRGGSGDEVTRDGASTLGGLTSAGPSLALEPGTRLLVAGDDTFAWSCGFTQPYDEDVARQWHEVLAG